MRTVFLLLACVTAFAAHADTIDYAGVMRGIADDIAALKPAYRQLAEFDAAKTGTDPVRIEYAYHTHRATSGGGWTAGVPNPDDDGVWFYLDFHDRDSTAQIHTQPVIAAQCIGDKRVSLLVLEGPATHPIQGELQKILRHHGVGRCERPRHAAGPNARIS